MQPLPHWSAVQRQATWLTLLQRKPGDLVTSICFGTHVTEADTLMLLIKASAVVTVYRGHCRTLCESYLLVINSLFIMCIGIIRNNSLVGGRARAESNPGHWARHALLHIAAECVNRSATWANAATCVSSKNCGCLLLVFLLSIDVTVVNLHRAFSCHRYTFDNLYSPTNVTVVIQNKTE